MKVLSFTSPHSKHHGGVLHPYQVPRQGKFKWVLVRSAEGRGEPSGMQEEAGEHEDVPWQPRGGTSLLKAFRDSLGEQWG